MAELGIGENVYYGYFLTIIMVHIYGLLIIVM